MNSVISKARFITLGLAVVLIPFSVRYCHWALLLFLITCLAERNFAAKGRTIVQNPLAWILPLFFLLHLISVLYSSNAGNAWGNLDKKIAFVLAPLVIVSANPFTKKQIQHVAWIFVGTCLVATLICFTNAVVISSSGEPLWNFGPKEPFLALHPDVSDRWAYFSYMGLSSAIDIHPTYFALYLYVCVLILLRTVNRRIGFLLIAYFLVFIVLLSSRIIVIATVVTIVGVILNAGFKRSWVVGGLALVLIASTLLINPVAQYRNTQEYRGSSFALPPAAMSDNPISIRVSLWWLSFRAVGEVNPIIGTGAGDVNDTIVALSDKFDVHNVLNTSDPHNQYLYTFIALGTLGLICLLAVFAVPLRILFQQGELIACAGIIAFMCVCLTESALELQKGIILFSLFVSITGNLAREWRFTTQRLKYA